MKEKTEKLVASCSPMLKSQVEAQAEGECESVAFIIRKAVRLYLRRMRGCDSVPSNNQRK